MPAGIPRRVTALCFRRWNKIIAETHLRMNASGNSSENGGWQRKYTGWHRQESRNHVSRCDKCRNFGGEYAEKKNSAIEREQHVLQLRIKNTQYMKPKLFWLQLI